MAVSLLDGGMILREVGGYAESKSAEGRPGRTLRRSSIA
jgi:hypothetical protein